MSYDQYSPEAYDEHRHRLPTINWARSINAQVVQCPRQCTHVVLRLHVQHNDPNCKCPENMHMLPVAIPSHPDQIDKLIDILKQAKLQAISMEKRVRN